MAADDADFSGLIRRIRAGDAAAQGELFAKYGRAIRLAVSRAMPEGLRRQYDSLDFVQDVWTSFLALPADRLTFDNPKALAGFLNRVAANKMLNALGAKDSTQARETAFTRSVADSDWRVARPSQFAVAVELWDDMIAALPPGYRPVLERLRDGYDHAEIAADLKITTRTVERVVRRLRKVYERSERRR